MAFGKGKAKVSTPVAADDIEDPTAWILNNEFANFVLMNTNEIKYMCMVGYAFLHGCKVFKKISPDAPASYKLVNLAMACTGGGIIVPILLNTIPVTLAIDAYPIAIVISYLLHTYFPVLREVLELSPIFKGAVVLFYETNRAYVVTLFTALAASTIAPTQFSVPVFGPIVCGTIAGCGGMFLPFDKGLGAIEANGLPPPVFSALVAAIFFHGVTQLDKSGGIDIVDVSRKAKVLVAIWFISYAYYKNGFFSSSKTTTATTTTKAVAIKTEKKEKKEKKNK